MYAQVKYNIAVLCHVVFPILTALNCIQLNRRCVINYELILFALTFSYLGQRK